MAKVKRMNGKTRARHRQAIAKRDGLFVDKGGGQHVVCYLCQTPIPYEEATLDHIEPLCSSTKEKESPNNKKNLAFSCEKCNHEKGGKSLKRCKVATLLSRIPMQEILASITAF